MCVEKGVDGVVGKVVGRQKAVGDDRESPDEFRR
jgi:hypothetical protein